MAAKHLIYNIYQDLVNAFKDTEIPVYLGRPKSISSAACTFMVLELPNEVNGLAAGDPDFSLRTWGLITLYVRSKNDATMNIGILSELIHTIQSKFPIKGRVAVCTQPTIKITGYDGYGFHSVKIAFRVRTYINSTNE